MMPFIIDDEANACYGLLFCIPGGEKATRKRRRNWKQPKNIRRPQRPRDIQEAGLLLAHVLVLALELH